MIAFALLGYPMKPQPVMLQKIEPADSHTPAMAITTDGARIPVSLVYTKKPRRKKVTDQYGTATVWSGKNVESNITSTIYFDR